MEPNYSFVKAEFVKPDSIRVLTMFCQIWRSHFATIQTRRRRNRQVPVSSAESLEVRSLLTPTAIFDFTAIASDLSATERFFGSNNAAHAPYTVIRYGEGTITSLTELPNASSAQAISGPLTFRFGSNDANNPVEAVTLSAFDDGISDGLADEVYMPDGVNDNPAVTLFLNGQPVATGTLKKLSLQTTPQLVTTSPASAPSELQLTAAAGKNRTIYKELLMATGGTGRLPFTLSPFSLQGRWAGVADASVYNSIGTTSIAPFSVDYGDLPDPAFRTLLSRDGARHRLTGTLKLGNSVTAETNGKPSSAANLDRDNGVTMPQLNPGTEAALSVRVSGGSGFLDGWIDFNQDGDFDDAGEHVMDDRSVTTGTNKVRIAVPLNASIGLTYARFRLSSTPVESPRGLAMDGEVEDYTATITLPTPTITAPAATTSLQRPEIAWSAVVGASRYNIYISNLSTGINRYHVATVTETSYIPTVDLGIGNFRLWLQAANATGNSARTARYDFTINTNATFRPVASVIENERPTLTWSAVPGAVRYEIFITDPRGNGVSDIRDKNIPGTSFTPASKMPLAAYNARVRGIAADGTAAKWSLKVEFEVVSPPARINGPGAKTVAQRPAITWTAVADAVSYKVKIKNLATPKVAPVVATSAMNHFTPPANLGIGAYYVWVQAVPANGQIRSWSSRYSFQIKTPVRVVRPASIMNSGRPTIRFKPLAGAVRYEIWLKNITTGGSTIVRDSHVKGTQWTPDSDLPISAYRFQVRGVNATGKFGQWSSVVNFRVATAPVLISPSASTATFDQTPTFTWGSVAGAVSYSFQLRNMTTGRLVRTVHNLNTRTWTEPADLPVGNYRWRSRAVGAMKLAANWSKPTDFSVGGVVRFTTPSGTLSKTPTFNWLTAGEAAGYYEIRISRIDVKESNVVRETKITGTSYSVSHPLVAGGSYRIWVRAISTSGEIGRWSRFLNFSVTTT